MGDSLLRLAIGGPGPALGHLSVTRFFALHVGLFSAAFIALVAIRAFLARRANIAAASGGNAGRYWPAQAWRGAVASLIVLAIILLLSCQHGVMPPEAGATLLSPADTDPSNGYNAARPEWFLVGVYEFSHWFAGQWAIIPIFIVPGLLVCLVLAMPFWAKRSLGHALQCPVHRCLADCRNGPQLHLAGQGPRQSGPSKGDCPGTKAGIAGVRACSP